MLTKIIMPQAGQDLETGVVVRWYKKEGDPVKKGEVVCEVETEKAVFDVDAPADGYLRKIVVQQGQTAKILSAIGLIGALEDAVDAEPPPPPGHAAAATNVATQPATPMNEQGSGGPPDRIRISPKAMRVAKERGIPIDQLHGSRPRGRVVEKDVLEYLERASANTDGSTVLPRPIEAESPVPFAPSEAQPISLSKVRKVTARRMQQSKQTVPHFYATVAVDMTDALNFRKEFNEALKGGAQEKLSLTHMITRACALALREIRELNSSFKDADTVIQWGEVNIGVAVALNDGMVVPVLQNADRLNLRQIAQETRRVVTLAREGKQASLAPSRFTVSNLGMYNIDNFIAIINPPEAAILAVGRVQKMVVVVDGDQIALRDRMNMTLSIDHRVGDGVLACKFVNRVKSLLEDPGTLL